MAEQTGALARVAGRDGALDAALSRLVSDHHVAVAASERADTPDLHVTAVRRLPAVQARYAAFPDTLDPRLIAALKLRGIDQIFTHQAEAIGHALDGRHVVVVTPTASGKTLCYNAPVLHSILQDRS